jgi:hypothetical protein
VNNYRKDWLIFSVPNERADFRELARLKSTGLTSGASDMVLVMPNEVVFVEVKDEKGKQSESQKKFEEKITKIGHRYILVRSLDEFKTQIT